MKEKTKMDPEVDGGGKIQAFNPQPHPEDDGGGKIQVFNPQPHYDNTNGSLYAAAERMGLNAYEFDILKRICRCRKKGRFKEDLQKIKDTVDIYLAEYDADQ